MNRILLILITVLYKPAFSQYKIDWANSFGNLSSERIYSLATDNNANVYVVGKFAQTMDIDPSSSTYNITSAGGEDAYLIKYDKAGNLVWGFAIGGNPSVDEGLAITIDKTNGFIYLAGSFTGTIDLDPGPAAFNLTATTAGLRETFVSKYNLNGNFICGSAFSNATSTSENYPNSISRLINGEFIVGGYFKGTVDFDPGPGSINKTDNGSGDIYLVRMDQNCNMVWVKSIGDSELETLLSVEQCNNGEIFISGEFKGVVDFDPGAGVALRSSNGTYADIFFGKYSSAGNYIWLNAFSNGASNPNSACSVAPDNNNDLIVCGRYWGTIDFDPDASAAFNLNSPGRFGAFFGKYSTTTGALVWVKSIVGPSTTFTALFSLDVDAQSNIHVWGEFSGGSLMALDVDPEVSSSYLLYHCKPLLYMNFIAEYDNNGNILCANSVCPSVATAGSYFSDKLIDVSAGEIYTISLNNDTTISTSSCNSPLNVQRLGGSDAVVVKFNRQLDAVLSSKTDSICFGDSLYISVFGGTDYVWNTGSTNDTLLIKPSITTTYSVLVSDSCSCTHPDTVYITVKVNDLVDPLISGDSVICFGDTAKLLANGQSSFVWSTGSADTQIFVSPATTTSYQLISTALCPGPPDNFTVKVNPLPPVDAGDDINIISGNPAFLQATGAVNWIWTPAGGLSCTNCSNPVASPGVTTLYCVFGTDTNGCEAYDCILVSVEDETVCNDIFVPTAFSPNGDGQNDVYYLLGNCIQQISFTIYDRWGEKVFETSDITKGWDGVYNSRQLNSGVFTYSLFARLITGVEVVGSGNISLVR